MQRVKYSPQERQLISHRVKQFMMAGDVSYIEAQVREVLSRMVGQPFTPDVAEYLTHCVMQVFEEDMDTAING